VLVPGGPPRDGGLARQAVDGDAAVGGRQIHELGLQLRSQHAEHPVARTLAGGQFQRPPAVDAQDKADLRVPQGQRLDRLGDPAGLGGLGAQELAPGRRVEKEVVDGDRGPRRSGRGARRRRLVALDINPSRLLGAGRPGDHRHPAHRRERRQGLAPETQRGNRVEVRRRVDLARGVRGHGQGQLVVDDAVTVVGDPDQVAAAVFDGDVDVRGPGVEGVLHELLDDAGRPLDHFAGGDLVYDERRQDVDGHAAILGESRPTPDAPSSHFMAMGMGRPRPKARGLTLSAGAIWSRLCWARSIMAVTSPTRSDSKSVSSTICSTDCSRSM
jgi:hypothetical protein